MCLVLLEELSSSLVLRIRRMPRRIVLDSIIEIHFLVSAFNLAKCGSTLLCVYENKTGPLIVIKAVNHLMYIPEICQRNIALASPFFTWTLVT